MEINWSIVKTKTLWQYNELIEKIFYVLEYSFVQEYYNHTMEVAADYSQQLQKGYLLNGKESTFISQITIDFKKLGSFGVKSYFDLIKRVNTKVNCELFLKDNDLNFENLIDILKYIFRWVLPFKCSVKELLQTITVLDIDYLPVLKRIGLRSNLDILETCRKKKDRSQLSGESGIPEKLILELTHRADMSRLAYVRGKTIKHLCGGGYNTLLKIENADLMNMIKDMTSYYATLGKDFSDFKAVIPLDWMKGGARVLPKIVEY